MKMRIKVRPADQTHLMVKDEHGAVVNICLSLSLSLIRRPASGERQSSRCDSSVCVTVQNLHLCARIIFYITHLCSCFICRLYSCYCLKVPGRIKHYHPLNLF